MTGYIDTVRRRDTNILTPIVNQNTRFQVGLNANASGSKSMAMGNSAEAI